MSDAAAPSPAKKATKAKKPAKKADHPPVAAMVTAAVKNLKDRKGSSLAAIKKYISANYKVDVAKLAPFIRRFLKKAVTDGKLSQTKGTGASGSFKLAAKVKEEKKPKAAKKPAAKKAKKPKAKKPAAKKEKKVKKAKSPKKAKKPAAKKPAKKATKSPKKAKKVAKKPAAAAKKAKK